MATVTLIGNFWHSKHLLLTYGSDTAGCHVGAANSFDLLNISELFVVEQLVKVNNDFIK